MVQLSRIPVGIRRDIVLTEAPSALSRGNRLSPSNEMPPPFQSLSLDEFARLLSRFPFERRLDGIHLHHTWRPDAEEWRGVSTLRVLWHTATLQLGWSDIAQHLTIDPAGQLWTGRDWNRPPCSIPWRNGKRDSGPFMITIVGNFNDDGRSLTSAQRDATVEVIARLQARFHLADDALMFHRDVDRLGNCSCPGTRIRRDDLGVEIAHRHLSLEPMVTQRSDPGPFGEDAEMWFQFIAICTHYRSLLRDEPAYFPEGTAEMLARQLAHLGTPP